MDDEIARLLKKAEERLRDAPKQANNKHEIPKSFRFPQLSTGELERQNVNEKTGLRKPRTTEEQNATKPKRELRMRKVEDPVVVRERLAEKKKATAGERWYNLPKTDLTPEMKRDLQLLKMRNVLDPHRHYKKEGGKLKAPEYSQVGTIIEGPTEYYSSRINNRDRKRTFVEEVLAGEQETGRFKRKYGEVQAKKTSGKKAFYKALKAKRSASYKKR